MITFHFQKKLYNSTSSLRAFLYESESIPLTLKKRFLHFFHRFDTTIIGKASETGV